MLRLFRGKGSHVSAERNRLQKELFAFNKTVSHGFPHHPSALAYDSSLNLLALATRHGLVRVYGTPGVEFSSQLENDIEIKQIVFIEGRAQLITLCADSSLQLWEINAKQENGKRSGVLEKVKTCEYFYEEAAKEGSQKQITTISINLNKDLLLIGTQTGNTFLLDLESFDLTDQIIYQDVVLQNIPDDYKFNPGAVEVIAEQPLNPNKFLIGYNNRGLLVLWDNNTLSAEHFYVANQQLESVNWLFNGEQFITSHNDGSYIVWRTSDNLQPSEQPKIPYGPFPCKAINKIVWKTVQNSEDLIIFSGGMPRASFNDKNTISIIQGSPDSGKHNVLDFTSKIIDFVVVSPRNNNTDADNPSTLIALVEEEIVLIDLTHPEWLQYRLPYLSSVHSSAITCCQHYSDVPEELYKKIVSAGQMQNSGKFTDKKWPINGGQINERSLETTKDLLITGHEDGSIRFWDSSDIAMHHIYTLNTSKFFLLMDDDIAAIDDDTALNDTNAEDEWPPFRKVGTFDPYSDDPRFAIRKIVLCIFSGTLIAAGTAGQVVLFEFKGESVEKALTTIPVNIVGDKDGFVWKGHSQLNPKNGNLKIDAGYQPLSIIQLQPPAAVTALALNSEWGLLAAGTAHGFGLFDYLQLKVIASKTTLNPNDLASVAGGDALISRRKSFKKSLRESFRRLRKGRSQRNPKRTASPSSSSSPGKSIEEGRKSPRNEVASSDGIEAKPIERQIEARSSDDSMGSMVRCLYFSNAYIINNSTQTSTLWVGTNAGIVYIYALTLPSEEKRKSDEINCQIAKEIQLKHHAPVIAIHILDGNGIPLPEPFEVKTGRAKSPTTPGFRVLICSEEQFKIFNLPTLKPLNKYKLTAHEGARGRRIAIARFINKSNDKHIEYCMLCLSNQGDITIFTIPELKRQTYFICTKREDINGISSLVFTKQAEGFYLHSSCEFRRFSLSAKRIVTPVCTVEDVIRKAVNERNVQSVTHFIDTSVRENIENDNEKREETKIEANLSEDHDDEPETDTSLANASVEIVDYTNAESPANDANTSKEMVNGFGDESPIEDSNARKEIVSESDNALPFDGTNVSKEVANDSNEDANASRDMVNGVNDGSPVDGHENSVFTSSSATVLQSEMPSKIADSYAS